jgi:hypothetical protein
MDFGALHVGTLLATIVIVLYADHEGFLYFRSKKLLLSRKSILWSHRLIWTGLSFMFLSGVGLILPAWEYWLSNPVFYVKMGFVLTLVINGVFIRNLSHIAVETPYAHLSPHTRTVLLTSGAISGVCWSGAIIVGFFFF